MRKGARENPMKELARWLKGGIHKFDSWGKFLDQALMALIILPVSVLFCLTMLGCDVQEGSPVGNV